MPRFLNNAKQKKADDNSVNLSELRAKMERDTIIEVLEMTKGNKKKASEILKLDRTVLYRKMSKYGIH